MIDVREERTNKIYVVTFSYGIDITAVDEEDATEKAFEIWDNVCPRVDEMNIDVKEIEEA